MAELPSLYTKEKLYTVSNERAKQFLNTEFANASAEDKGWFMEQINQMDAALSGDIRACSTIAHVFSDTAYPGMADPQLAYQWYGWGHMQTDSTNWSAFQGMPGGDLDGTLRMFKFFAAKTLAVFGTPAEQQLARDIMTEYIDIYRGSKYLGTLVSALVYTLCGIPADKVFRTGKYDMSCIVNKDLAIQYYKQMIDDELAAGHTDAAKIYANEFESILGISYYKGSSNSSKSNSSASTPSKHGCYVATCVYGSYDCPQVWTLRRYRDCCLAESCLGRAFIKVYYAVSPYLVRCFGQCQPIRAVWKKILDDMVSNLKSKGYSDTPYDD